MSDTLEDRLAHSLRDTGKWLNQRGHVLHSDAQAALDDFDRAHRKPDAAERAAEAILARQAQYLGHSVVKEFSQAIDIANIVRLEIAHDNAERDARDREREEAVRRLLGMYTVCTTPGCQCASGSIVIGVRRAFGWDKEGT